MHRFTISVDDDLHAHLQARAQQEDRSLSQMVVRLARAGLQQSPPGLVVMHREGVTTSAPALPGTRGKRGDVEAIPKR